MLKLNFPFHPILFGLYPILFLFSNNLVETSLNELIRPIFFTLSIILSVYFIIHITEKDIFRWGIILSYGIFLFYSFGIILNKLGPLQIGDLLLDRFPQLIVLIYFIVFCCGFYLITKMHTYTDITKILNFISIILIVISVGNIVINYSLFIPVNPGKNFSPVLNNNSNPDIYYIILDGYAGEETLRKLYDYDNTPFLSNLSQRGFYIVKNSTSNYQTSMLSLASSLNSSYLDENLIDLDWPNRNDPKGKELVNLIENGYSIKFLKSQGYKFIFLKSGFLLTDFNKNADYTLNKYIFTEFENKLISDTPIPIFFYENTFSSLSGFFDRMRIQNSFEELSGVPTISGKKFVFAHIIAPHPPYVFGKYGEAISVSQNRSCEIQKAAYLNQLIYINNLTEKTIEKIISQSKKPPIIIIQSDHGSKFQEYCEINYDDKFLEAMPNIIAYYLPEYKGIHLKNNMTPVNTFRIIFNGYFNQTMPILDDKIYYNNTWYS